ncbi:unnamed protein product [Microthlaspi erraticum]|uniref:Acireductone dioxygenase n=1 Tax=Microthlaspi erraticum TaxID=1685480 RepID=A0A6D2I4N4_9BRAS|nr:unnamed protein product [Microthlaspi erraticum]
MTLKIEAFTTPRRSVMAIEAWFMDDSNEDQRLPHHRNPKELVTLDYLADLGVLYWKLNSESYENDSELRKIREARGYDYMDLLDLCPEKVSNYEEKLKNFFTEHIHQDEEIRYCLEGSGYFDVRDKDDRWIRIWMKPGDLIVLPAGIYHRFTLDTGNYIKLMRLFVGEPVWTPYNRPQEEHPGLTHKVSGRSKLMINPRVSGNTTKRSGLSSSRRFRLEVKNTTEEKVVVSLVTNSSSFSFSSSSPVVLLGGSLWR